MGLTRGELEEAIAGMRPAGIRKTITFDGGITSGKISTKAAVNTSLTGTNNDMSYTADTAGVAGNSITIQYASTNYEPGHSSATVTVQGSAIVVDLKTSAGVKASKVLTTDNTELTDGDTVTIGTTVYRFKDTMTQAYDVKRDGTTADTTMGNLIKAINGTGTPGTEYFAGTVAHTQVDAGALAAHAFTVTAKTVGAAGNLIAIAESSSHLSWAGGAVFLSGGEDVNQVLSLASEVKTAVEAFAPAAALVDLANLGGNDGTGVVTTMAATALTGGSDGKIPLFTVTGSILASLRGYCATTLTGATGTLVHGVTGTTNLMIPIFTGTNLTAGKSIDSSGIIPRGQQALKLPIALHDESVFATAATATIDGGKIHYVLDYIALTKDATVVAA